jgi:hypothetical protein
MDFTIEKSPKVSTNEWLKPVSAEKLHTVVRTPIGEFSLYRRPGRRQTAEAKADNWEEWSLVLDGRTVLTIEDASAPWASLHKRVRQGLNGQLDGKTFRLHAKRSLLASGRTVQFLFADGSLRFGAEGPSIALHEEAPSGRRLLAEARRGRWRCEDLTPPVAAVLSLYVAAGLDVFLESPLWDIFPF